MLQKKKRRKKSNNDGVVGWLIQTTAFFKTGAKAAQHSVLKLSSYPPPKKSPPDFRVTACGEKILGLQAIHKVHAQSTMGAGLVFSVSTAISTVNTASTCRVPSS